MTYVLTVANQKGGVGKTTTSLNLCYALSNFHNKPTLLIDIDSQASSSLCLGIDVLENSDISIYDILDPYVNREITQLSWDFVKKAIYTPTYIETVRDPDDSMKWIRVEKPFGFDCMPSELNLSLVELNMGIVGNRSGGRGIYPYYLRDLIDVIKAQNIYSFIIIDSPPSLGSLSINAIAAATDGVLITSNMDVLSMRGVHSLCDTVNTVQGWNSKHRGVLGILFSLYSDRRSVDKSVSEWAKSFLPIGSLKTRIPETTDVKKANSSMYVVCQINKKMAKAYDSLANEIIYAVEHPDEPVGTARDYQSDIEERQTKTENEVK